MSAYRDFVLMPARLKIDPGDVPPDAAARHMGCTPAEFREILPELLARGFPAADPTTGNFALDAIDVWRRRRFPHLFPLTPADAPKQDRETVRERIARM
jgi:hypothetical protein